MGTVARKDVMLMVAVNSPSTFKHLLKALLSISIQTLDPSLIEEAYLSKARKSEYASILFKELVTA